MGENATAAVRARKLPIVIVPGTMGTRLTDPATGDLVWNPTASPGIFAADDSRLADMSKPLVPDETHGFPVHDKRFVQTLNIRHMNNLIFKFYGPLAIAMKHDLRKRLAPKNIVPVVFGCGYDFRVDNAQSAQRLRTIVNEAQEECDGEPAIIIAHSMGGLITRHFCKNLGGEARVRAIILLASPTLGAPDAYITLRTGIDEIFPLRLVLFMLQETSRRFTRVMPSVYQLLPNIVYGKLDKDWLTFDASQTGFSRTPPPVRSGSTFSDARENFFVFRDIYTGLADDVSFRALSDQHLATALAFDTGLLVGLDSMYLHPRSFLVAGTGISTKGKANVVFDGVASTGGNVVVVSRVVQGNGVDGDKTVPLISAAPTNVQPAPLATVTFAGVSHQDVPADRAVIQDVMTRIDSIL